jgi:hypothetical protein
MASKTLGFSETCLVLLFRLLICWERERLLGFPIFWWCKLCSDASDNCSLIPCLLAFQHAVNLVINLWCPGPRGCHDAAVACCGGRMWLNDSFSSCIAEWSPNSKGLYYLVSLQR